MKPSFYKNYENLIIFIQCARKFSNLATRTITVQKNGLQQCCCACGEITKLSVSNCINIQTDMEILYSLSLGLVPESSDDNPESDPMWGLDVVFTKRAEINYGPWVDLQRYQ